MSWQPGNLLSQLLIVNLLILTSSAFLQSTAGFGAALFGLPLLLWAGNTLVEAQLMILSAMLPQNVFACWRLRKSIDYREVAVPALIRIVSMPIGVAGLVYLMQLPNEAIGQFVGVVILVAMGIQYFTGLEWKNARKWHWLLLTFGGSGILQGLTGTGGPPMVLWVYGQNYTIDRARAFLFAIYVVSFIPQLALLSWTFGGVVWIPIITAMISLPAILISSELGLKIGSRIGNHRMRPLTYLTLVLLAVAAIAEPWLKS